MKSIINLGLVFFIAIVVVFASCFSYADVPHIIDYHGYVKSNNIPFNGTGSFKFAITNSGATTTYWSNDGTSSAGSEPTAAVSITVANGVFNVRLGDSSVTNMTEIDTSVFTENETTYLRVWFNDGTNDSQRLTPDKQIVSVPYAYTAYSADTLSGSISTSSMPSGGSWSLSSDLNIDSNTLYVDESTNRVGFGTTSPDSTLDITGTLTMNGDIVTDRWLGTSTETNLFLGQGVAGAGNLNNTTGNEGYYNTFL